MRDRILPEAIPWRAWFCRRVPAHTHRARARVAAWRCSLVRRVGRVVGGARGVEQDTRVGFRTGVDRRDLTRAAGARQSDLARRLERAAWFAATPARGTHGVPRSVVAARALGAARAARTTRLTNEPTGLTRRRVEPRAHAQQVRSAAAVRAARPVDVAAAHARLGATDGAAVGARARAAAAAHLIDAATRTRAKAAPRRAREVGLACVALEAAELIDRATGVAQVVARAAQPRAAPRSVAAAIAREATRRRAAGVAPGERGRDDARDRGAQRASDARATRARANAARCGRSADHAFEHARGEARPQRAGPRRGARGARARAQSMCVIASIILA